MRDDADIVLIEGQDSASVALRAGDDRGIDGAERQVCDAPGELADPTEIAVPAVEAEGTLSAVAKERLEHRLAHAGFDDVADFAEDRRRDDEWRSLLAKGPRHCVVVLVRAVEERDDRRRVERDHPRGDGRNGRASCVAHSPRDRVSLPRPLTEASETMPIARGHGAVLRHTARCSD